MKHVERSEILDYVTYGEQRDAIRGSALRAKSVRRVLVGEYFTFLFENRETVLYQVQEMTRIRDTFEPDPATHRTYSELYNVVYKKMYRRLKPLYEQIREITGYPQKR